MAAASGYSDFAYVPPYDATTPLPDCETSPRTITTATASIALSLFEPTVITPQVAIPTSRAIVLSTFAPSLTGSKTTIPATVSLVTTVFTPQVVTPQVVTPTTKVSILNTYAPNLLSVITVTPAPLTLLTSTLVPVVITPQVVIPVTKALSITTYAPTIVKPLVAIPATAALTITAFAPTTKIPQVAVPTTTALNITTYAPSLPGCTKVIYIGEFVQSLSGGLCTAPTCGVLVGSASGSGGTTVEYYACCQCTIPADCGFPPFDRVTWSTGTLPSDIATTNGYTGFTYGPGFSAGSPLPACP